MGEIKMNNTNKYLALYPDGHHEEIELGEVLNKGGAAGKIFKDLSHENSVAKIYHEREKSETNRKKLEAMLLNRPNIPLIENEGKKYIQIAWPTALLEDSQGYCVGYLMPMIDTKEAISLDHLMQKAVRQKLGLSERYIDRVFAAYNITSVVAALHDCGHYIVDLKPANVSVYKSTMLVVMFDCDGFSIKGEQGNRYPAEYVSEEYIYPEGKDETCEQMGEEQDKFALATIIFRLLNEGIHPFSGMPRQTEDMLSIQERIFKYHYAYGMWPDAYQAPNPNSIHEFFDSKTLNLFERAFGKGNSRPSAIEWQDHLADVLEKMKHQRCKKNHNHYYYTPKGCGLCVVEEKIKNRLKEQQEKAEQSKKMVRGVDISKIGQNNLLKQKKNSDENKTNIQRVYYSTIAGLFLLFSFVRKIISPFDEQLQNCGMFVQLILLSLCIFVLNQGLKQFSGKMPENLNRSWLVMIKIYAIVCLIIAFIAVNSINFSIFALAD